MKPRPPVNTILAALSILMIFVFSGGCLAQGAPPVPDRNIRNAQTLNDDANQKIKTYAEYWAAQMSSEQSDPAKIEIARVSLTQPLRTGSSSATFRFEYSALVLKSLKGLLEEDQNPHATLNALIVFGELGSRNALNLLVEHSDVSKETRVDIRIKSSMNCLKLLTYNTKDLKPREIGSAMRLLRNAATRETNPIALRHQLLAILIVETPEAREAVVIALENVVDKIAAHADGTSPLIEPFYVAVAELRTRVINLRSPQKTELGQSLGPCLIKFLVTASNQWDNTHQTETDVTCYAKPIRVSEAILKIMINATPNITPPTTSLRTNWEDNDKKQEFIQQVNEWDSLFRHPPFSR